LKSEIWKNWRKILKRFGMEEGWGRRLPWLQVFY
jgi:hypothetical protein